jgi:hypothetical protein
VHAGFWCGNLRERDLFEDLGVDGRIILKWTFKKQNGRAWIGFIWKRTGTMRGVVNMIMNLRVPLYVRNFLTS